MLDPNFVIFGFVLNALGSLSYFWAVLRGQAKPNKVTWFLWGIFPLIAGLAQLSQGVGLSVLTTFSAAFSSFIVLLAALFNKKAYWKLGRLDWFCGGLAVLGFFLWQLTDRPNLAIGFAIAADFLAGVPTIVKAFKAPESESPWAFLLGFVNYALCLFTLEVWDFAHVAFPIQAASTCLVLFILIRFKAGVFLSKKS